MLPARPEGVMKPVLAIVAILSFFSCGCLSPLTSRLDETNRQIAALNEQITFLNHQLGEMDAKLAESNRKLERIARAFE